MASIHKVTPRTKDGNGKPRWRVRYRGPDNSQRSKTLARKIDAEKFAAQVEHSKATGTFINPSLGRTPIEKASSEWLAEVEGTLKPKTVASYDSLIRSRIVPALGRRSLAALKPSEVQRWINDMHKEGLSPSRIHQALVTLKQVLDRAVRDGAVGRNVALGIKLPRLQHKEAQFFEAPTVDAIVDATRKPYDLLVRILGVCGLRFGEGIGLQRRHVDLVHKRLLIRQSLAEVAGVIYVGSTKTHAERAVPISASLRDALEAHLETVGTKPTDYVFTSPAGSYVRYRDFLRRVWAPTLERAKVPYASLHVLRHSAAARMISAGASAKTVQVILGHRSVAFTLTVYGHLYDSDLDTLAESLEVVETARVIPLA